MNGKQTILVVDDESSIRDMVQLSLELAGFNLSLIHISEPTRPY